MQVQQILKQKPEGGVLTIQPGSSVADAAQLMSQKKVGALIVSKGGTDALGILSERDIVSELGRRGPSCMSDKVDDLMTSTLVTCSVDEKASEVLKKMTEGRFRHMPVIQDGGMVGLISIGDVVKARLDQLSMEKEALEGMIMGF